MTVGIDPISLIATLSAAGIPFVVTGSLAAVAHGSPLPLTRLDITTPTVAGDVFELIGAPSAEQVADGDSVHALSTYGPIAITTSASRYRSLSRNAIDMDLGAGDLTQVAAIRDLIVEADRSDDLGAALHRLALEEVALVGEEMAAERLLG